MAATLQRIFANMRDIFWCFILSFHFCKEGMFVACFENVKLLLPSQNKGAVKDLYRLKLIQDTKSAY
jgi:hypothetical protein